MRRLWLTVLFAVAGLASTPAAGQVVQIEVNGQGSAFVINFLSGFSQERADTVAAAAQVWADTIQSTVPVEIDFQFVPLPCDRRSAVLGSAGTQTVHRDFPGAPFPGTFYSAALANALSGTDQSTASDITASFNSSIDDPAQDDSCLAGVDWHYGTSPPPPGTIGFFGTVLHEIAHGLGFQSFYDLETGSRFFGQEDQFTQFLRDQDLGLDLVGASDDARRDASIKDGELVWNGPAVNTAAQSFIQDDQGLNADQVRMYAPNPLEPGSSVAHFDTDVTPNELMEPFNTGTLDFTLTQALFQDIGWRSADAPVIVGQEDLRVSEDESLTLTLSDFTIQDPDSIVPDDIQLTVLAGSNYTLNGNTIQPDPDFNGSLTVPVQANDGTQDGPVFNAVVIVEPVNDPPRIVGGPSLAIDEDTTLSLAVTDFQIEDPDNGPGDFTLLVEAGADYQVDGTSVTPDPDFFGTIQIGVRVRDSEATSPLFILVVSVEPVNDPPVITAQTPLSVLEDQSLRLTVEDLAIEDIDGPAGSLSIRVEPGPNYTAQGNLVTPAADFAGTLSVIVVANDGLDDSEPFEVLVSVIPSPDPPVIVEQSPIVVPEDTPFTISPDQLTIRDPDSDSFTLTLLPGDNYSFLGQTVTPATNFFGPLTVQVSARDESQSGPVFGVLVTVEPVNDPPVIVGQQNVFTFEQTARELSVADLVVEDPDNETAQLTLNVFGGTGYDFDDTVITPQAGLTGQLLVPVTVFDGTDESDPFALQVSVADPALSEPLTLDASGLFTPRPDFEPPSALGVLADPINVTLFMAPDFLRPGRHAVVWQEIDGDGNIAQVEQPLEVRPIISLGPAHRLGEGTDASVRIVGNGPSPRAVTVPYFVSGSAGPEDHGLSDGRVELREGARSATVAYATTSDGLTEAPELLRVQLGSGPANIDTGDVLEVTIEDGSPTPVLRLVARQSSRVSAVVFRDQGPVTVTASEATDFTLVPSIGLLQQADDSVTFDPSVAPDELTIQAVSPRGLSMGATTDGFARRTLRIVVRDQPPEFSDALATTDRDGDGVSDTDERLVDRDLDGILDELDPWALLQVQPLGPGTIDGVIQTRVVEGEAGIRLVAGPFATPEDGLRVPSEAVPPDDDSRVDDPVSLYVTELDGPGQSVQVVVPLPAGAPDEAFARILSASQWSDFGLGPNDSLASAPPSQGLCPRPESPAYREGINPEDACIRFRISDGGPNDRDGMVDQEIELVLAVVDAAEPPASDTVSPVPIDDGSMAAIEGSCACRDIPARRAAPPVGWIVGLLAFATWIGLRRRARS
ncbi:MAG: Ig-like domain-containing protein [Myxococcota bacterium]